MLDIISFGSWSDRTGRLQRVVYHNTHPVAHIELRDTGDYALYAKIIDHPPKKYELFMLKGIEPDPNPYTLIAQILGPKRELFLQSIGLILLSYEEVVEQMRKAGMNELDTEND